MTDAQVRVLAEYPSARCIYHSDHGVFKVYRMIGECRVALTKGWKSEGMAWHDAMRRIEEKSQAKCEQAAVLDQIERG